MHFTDARLSGRSDDSIEMRRGAVFRIAFATSLGAGLLVTGGGFATGPGPLPRIEITKATVDRRAQTVDVLLRICFSAGPRGLIAISERRRLDGVEKARHDWVPQGVRPTRISPFSCRANWRLNWLLERNLRGPGTYTATIRVKDAYGRWTQPVALSVTSS